MKLQLILENVGGGSHFLASGREHPDAYRFEAVPGLAHLVSLTIDGKDLERVSGDLLALYGMPETVVRAVAIFEEADAALAAENIGATVTAERDSLLATNGELLREIELLKNGLAEARALLTADKKGGERITDDQLAYLGERDAIIDVIKPLALEYETPLDVVVRLAHIVGNPPHSSLTTTLTEGQDGTASVEHAIKHDGIQIPTDESQPEGGAPIGTFDEPARRAILEKLKPGRLKAIASQIPGIQEVTGKAELIEAILMHEATKAAQAEAA